MSQSSQTFLLILFVLFASIAAQSSNSCLKIEDSQLCLAWNGYSTYRGVLSYRNSNDLDSDIFKESRTYSASTYIYQHLIDAGCSASRVIQEDLRYAQTAWCSFVFQVSTLGNNQTAPETGCADNLQMPKICTETCATFIASTDSILQDRNICPNANSSSIANANKFFTVLCTGSSVGGNCVQSTGDDVNSCGFGSDKKTSAAKFCLENPGNSCCSSLSESLPPLPTSTNGSSDGSTDLASLNAPSSSLSTPVIVGIVGGIIALILLLIIVILLIKKRKEKAKDFQSGTTYSTPLAFSASDIGKSFRAKAQYYKENPDELSVDQNDVVILTSLNMNEPGWGHAFNQITNVGGLIPLSILEPLDHRASALHTPSTTFMSQPNEFTPQPVFTTHTGIPHGPLYYEQPQSTVSQSNNGSVFTGTGSAGTTPYNV